MTSADRHHLNAARGWLELGSVNEAFAELDEIAPESRAHLDVIKTRWEAYRAAKKWSEAIEIARGLTVMAPDDFDGWWMLSFALHESKRTQEAYDSLASVRARFTGEFVTHYNLACYLVQLGRIEEARPCLAKAFKLNPAQRVEALSDTDLQPLWLEIQSGAIKNPP